MTVFFVCFSRYASYAAQPSQSYGQSAQVRFHIDHNFSKIYISSCTYLDSDVFSVDCLIKCCGFFYAVA